MFDPDAEVYTYDVKNKNILCILRECEGERFFGIFNFSDREETAWMQEDGYYRNLVTGEILQLNNMVIPGHRFLWIKLI